MCSATGFREVLFLRVTCSIPCVLLFIIMNIEHVLAINILSVVEIMLWVN